MTVWQLQRVLRSQQTGILYDSEVVKPVLLSLAVYSMTCSVVELSTQY